MRIEIIYSNGSEITSFELESNPFKVGEVINVEVNNRNKSFWNVDEINEDFKIEKIEHFLRKEHSLNKNVSVYFCVSVEVSKIN